jgi:hypothetical protein
MNTRDEIKAIWGKISDLNWRLTKARANLVPATDPTQFAFMDHFSDADIHFWYKQLNNAVGKTITEPAGSDLVFTITAGVNARWLSGTDLAPKISLGNPGFPYYLETKISAGSIMPATLTQAGLWVGQAEGSTATETIMFGCTGAGCQYFDMTTFGADRGPIGFPIYMRFRVSGQPSGGGTYGGYRFSAQYSSDGISWTTYQNALGVDWYWWNSSMRSYNCGLFVRNWSTHPGSMIKFDYLRIYRDFGPGGV